jgi:hypothetical protein
LPLLHSHFAFLRLGVCHEQISVPIRRGREDGDLYGSVVISLRFLMKKSFFDLICVARVPFCACGGSSAVLLLEQFCSEILLWSRSYADLCY